MAGWAKLRVSGERGQKISLKCAEDFDPDGKASRGLTQHTYGRYQTDEFILSGNGTETLLPTSPITGFSMCG
jgi:alpha-L-rhamnosidase